MSDPDCESISAASSGKPRDRSDKTNHSNDRYRKPRTHRLVGVTLALAGAGILAFSLPFFLFHPMTATDEYIGTRLWIVGSWLLGGGVTLTIARPWIAALVGFFSPTLTFGIAMLLYFVLLFLAPILS